MDRIKRLCAYLTPCKVFADVGCDHGYCTQYMLKNGLCERAVITDISQKSLKKAETLLEPYIKAGKCTSKCCFGLEKVENTVDFVLIAGMGGEEIISILSSAFIPENFLLQPMHNEKKLREFLLERGVEITVDEPFLSRGKFYFAIGGKKSGKKTVYSKAQLIYGLGKPEGVRKDYIIDQIQKKRGYLSGGVSEKSRAEIQAEIDFAEGVLKGEIE